MKLLLIAPVFPPQRSVASLRTHAFATAWAAAGHDVTVLTTKKRSDQTGLSLPVHGFRLVELDYAGPRVFEWLRGRSRSAPNRPASETLVRPRLHQRVARWFKNRTGIFSFVRQPDLTDAWVEPAVAWARANGPWDVAYSSFGPPAALMVGLWLKSREMSGTGSEFRPAGSTTTRTAACSHLRSPSAAGNGGCCNRRSSGDGVPGLAQRLEQKSGKPVEVFTTASTRPAWRRSP